MARRRPGLGRHPLGAAALELRAPSRPLAPVGARLPRDRAAAAGRDVGRRQLSAPDPSSVYFPGLTRPPTLGDFGFVLYRNGLVLALHALRLRRGLHRRLVAAAGGRGLHGHLALGPRPRPARSRSRFVVAATLFSLGTQAYALGSGRLDAVGAARRVPGAAAGRRSRRTRVPELFALFLPLAAWTIAGRRGAWNELLAATFVTIAIAIPILVAAAAIETWVTPAFCCAALAG